MSLFLGKIHYWLYNKIQWAEQTEQALIHWASGQGLPAKQWASEARQKYGDPTGGRALEEIVDTSNIHGSLQHFISCVELRQADLITRILEVNPSYLDELVKVNLEVGAAAADAYVTRPENHGSRPDSPDRLFLALQDYVLEGMPCDRVNQAVSETEQEYVWQTTSCLHTQYWQQAGGDVANFYVLRDAWVKGFIQKLNSSYHYEKRGASTYGIVKKEGGCSE